MTDTLITEAAVSAALAPLAQTLAADDYRLSCSLTEPRNVLVTVVAGPEACAECLVPKELTQRMAVERLRQLDASVPWTVAIRYPADAAETTP